MKYDTTYSIINVSTQLDDESNYQKWYDIIFNYCSEQSFTRFYKQELAVEKIMEKFSIDESSAWNFIHIIYDMDTFMSGRHKLNCAADYENFSQKLTKAFMMML